MNSAQKRTKRRKLKRKLKRCGSNGLCYYCRGGMRAGSHDPPTIEHLVARADGGGNGLDNLRLAHRSCNQAVARLPAEIKRRLAGAMKRGALPAWVIEEIDDPALAPAILRPAIKARVWYEQAEP